MTTDTDVEQKPAGIKKANGLVFVRLEATQIASLWEQLKYGISQAMPPGVPVEGEVVLSKMLTGLLDGWLTAWVGLKGAEVQGSIITNITEDQGLGIKNLLVYSLYWTDKMQPGDWEEGLRVLRTWAKKHECHRIVGYTVVPEVVKWVRRMGGKADTVMVELEV